MPQLVALAVVGAGLFAGYRWLSRVAGQAAAGVRAAEDEMRRRASVEEPRNLGALEFDPASGTYRPTGRE